METVYALLVGIGLAAASGLRVFLPLFGLALGARLGGLEISDSMAWLASTEALLALATATVLEAGAYYLPLLDHLLDAFTTPMAVMAGTLATGTVLAGMDDPMLKWGLALIAGGSTAGMVQTASVAARAVSLATTGGLGNPVVATFEWLGALAATLLALLLPVLLAAVLVLALAWHLRRRVSASARAARLPRGTR